MVNDETEYGRIMERGRKNLVPYTAFLNTIRKNRRLPLDRMFHDAGEEAFTRIDCMKCGRCCSGLGPRLGERDISRLAGRERIKPATFIDQYLKTDEEGDLVFTSMPCPFFGGDGYCLVYEDRPDACRDYPHMSRGRQKTRIPLHIENLRHCPALILAVEFLMGEGNQSTVR